MAQGDASTRIALQRNTSKSPAVVLASPSATDAVIVPVCGKSQTTRQKMQTSIFLVGHKQHLGSQQIKISRWRVLRNKKIGR